MASERSKSKHRPRWRSSALRVSALTIVFAAGWLVFPKTSSVVLPQREQTDSEILQRSPRSVRSATDDVRKNTHPIIGPQLASHNKRHHFNDASGPGDTSKFHPAISTIANPQTLIPASTFTSDDWSLDAYSNIRSRPCLWSRQRRSRRGLPRFYNRVKIRHKKFLDAKHRRPPIYATINIVPNNSKSDDGNRRKRYYYYYRDEKGHLCYTYYPIYCEYQYECNYPMTPRPTYGPKSKDWKGLKYGCQCDEKGSKIKQCDIVTGHCICLPHVIGHTCNQCESGYWGLEEGNGCQKCECDPIGTIGGSCDTKSGVCNCRPGIGGEKCDSCLPGHYGFSNAGCLRCDICSTGQICDPDTGRCICPPLAQGPSCNECRPGSWGLEMYKGCKYCNCSSVGSIHSRCDPSNGQCICQEGFSGSRCDKCDSSYYGYPRCRPCACNYAGTLSEACDENNQCFCDENGQCPCKANVIGTKCDKCIDGTFDLSSDNLSGCTQCFCFGRTSHCTQAGLTWGHIKLNIPRILSIQYIEESYETSVNYIVVNKFGERENKIYKEKINSELNITNGITLIPDTEGNVTIDVNYDFPYPLYWSLPKKFLGDRVTSYGGFLKFRIECSGTLERIPYKIFKQYPLVQLHTHNELILEYYEILPPTNDIYHIRFHESLWTIKYSKSGSFHQHSVNRTILMIALQKIDAIYIRGTNYIHPTFAKLSDVSMDTAITIKGQPALLAKSIELCSCPFQYSSTSCQDPSIGFYIPQHKLVSNASGTIIIQLIGKAEPCKCNGRSKVCDKNTGHCLNCSDNTGGLYCDQCAEGFYGDPFNPTGCVPCPCPHTAKNHASSCQIRAERVICQCKEGYTGPDCSLCARGFWLGDDGICRRCECNGDGVIKSIHGGHSECHPTTGQCSCYPHVTGMRCDSCITPRYHLQGSTCMPCDNCSQILLDTVELMSYELTKDTEHLQNGTIPKPWIVLYELSNKTSFLKIDLNNIISAVNKFHMLPANFFKDLMLKSETLLIDGKGIEEKLNGSNSDMCRLNHEANLLFDKLMETRKTLENRIGELEDFSRYDKHLNVNKVIKEARQMLKEIRNSNFRNVIRNTEDTFDKANLKSAIINEYIYKIKDHNNKIETLKNGFNDWFNNIDELDDFIEDTWDKIDIVEKSGEDHSKKLKTLEKKKHQIELLYDDIVEINNHQWNNKSKVIFQECEDGILNLIHSLRHLKNLVNETETWEGTLYRINPDYREKYLEPAKKHAQNLSSIAKIYKDLFIETEDGAGSAIIASSAYNNIVKTIEAANNITNEALSIAQVADKTALGEKFLQSDIKSGTLLDVSETLKLKSNKLLHRAAQISLKHVRSSLEKSLQKIDKIRAFIRSLAWKDKDLYAGTKNFNTMEIEKNLGIANNKSDKIYKTMEALYKEADTINKDITYKLKVKLEDLKSHGDDKIGKAEEKVSLVRGNIQRATHLAISLSNAAQQREAEVKRANISLSESLQLLKDQIQRAKHAADGIRISMRSSEIGCMRSYQIPNLVPTTTTNIVITLSLTADNIRDSILFYLPSTSTTDFVKLEISNKRVKFSWNLGGDTAYIIHPEILEPYNENTFDYSWYKIEILRVWNIGKLTVEKVFMQSDVMSASSTSASNSSNSLWGIFNIKPGDLAWIGGINHQSEKNKGLPGCLYKLYYNGKQIGLWNFYTQSNKNGCQGCIDGAEEVKIAEQNMFYWNGAGYSVLKRSDIRPYNKNQFSILLTFRTLDENALLFLAVDEANNRSISLQLREGRVVFRIDYAGESRLEINTTEKYNTGKFVQIQAARVFIKRKIEKGSLKVDGYEQLGSPNPPVIHSSSLPDLTHSDYLVGGTPPLWRPTPITHSLPPPFLGCMGEISIDQEGYNPMDTKVHYGVESFCSDKALTSVGFYGDGYLELSSHTINKKSHFGFMFRTLQPSVFLLFSAPTHYNFINAGESTFDNMFTTEAGYELLGGPFGNEEFYSFSLVGGKIHLLMNAGKGDLKLVSNTTELNDGHFHAISIIKTGRKIELFIDDNLQGSGSLPPGATVIHSSLSYINGNTSRGLFLGGVPNNLNESDITNQYVASTIPLRGAIKDIILDGKVISVDNVIDMNHAYIGRLGPAMGEELEIGANLLNTQETDYDSNRSARGCRKVYSYTLEPGAVKFGDVRNSYTQVQLIGRNIWQKDFTLEFDFRTFYPSGLLFVAPGIKEKQRHLIALYLRDANITFLIKGKRKKELTIPSKVNNGMWHHVIVRSNQRRLSLTVGTRSVLSRMPKKMLLSNSIYIGGIPEKSTLIMLPEQISKMEGFRGCIRRLNVNGKLEDLVRDAALHQNVGQCFPSVEMGSYFPGDAYAVYKRQFVISPHLELRLEFRTVETNGVLLSVAHPHANTPALSLELHNAEVVMSVLTGLGRRFTVTTSLPTKFGLCDNTWHNITALFSVDELTVRVDQQPEETDVGTRLFPGDVTPPSINSLDLHMPLYIGGLPESAPTGTLTIKDNFKGCIRNVAIQGRRNDWIDMDYLHNVLLNSCPIQ